MMRRIIITLFVLMALSVSAQEKNAGCYLRMVEPISSDTLSAQNDLVKITFEFWPSNIFVSLRIENLTDSSIEIDWDKFTYVSGKTTLPIVFDDTVMALVDAPKGKSTIAPHSILHKKIAPKDNIEYGYKLYEKKYVKYGPARMSFNFPIESNGEHSNFKCTVEAFLKK